MFFLLSCFIVCVVVVIIPRTIITYINSPAIYSTMPLESTMIWLDTYILFFK